MIRKSERLQTLVHLLTAFVVFMKGITKLGEPKYLPFVAIFFTAALLIVLGTLYHHRLAHRFRYFDAAFYFLEAIVLSLVAYLQAGDGKRYLPFITAAAVIGYLIAAFISGAVKSRRQTS